MSLKGREGPVNHLCLLVTTKERLLPEPCFRNIGGRYIFIHNTTRLILRQRLKITNSDPGLNQPESVFKRMDVCIDTISRSVRDILAAWWLVASCLVYSTVTVNSHSTLPVHRWPVSWINKSVYRTAAGDRQIYEFHSIKGPASWCSHATGENTYCLNLKGVVQGKLTYNPCADGKMILSLKQKTCIADIVG